MKTPDRFGGRGLRYALVSVSVSFTSNICNILYGVTKYVRQRRTCGTVQAPARRTKAAVWRLPTTKINA